MRRIVTLIILLAALNVSAQNPHTSRKTIHHYVFFNLERERIAEESFLSTKAFEGAQLKYTWRELEPRKDEYDFSAIRKDLAFLNSRGKKLFIQLQDVTFSARRVFVPEYLRSDEYNGGVAPQYNSDQVNAQISGWVALRWNRLVQDRLHKLFAALGKEFDGKIEGINLAETALGFGRPDRHAQGFSPEIYPAAVIANMKALKRAFPKSVVMQYANFMPGEWLPGEDKSYCARFIKQRERMGLQLADPTCCRLGAGS